MENIECPEPKEPPVSHNHESYRASKQITPDVYNKQIINDQMHQPFAYFPTACTRVLPYGTVQMGLNVPSTAYNSSIWAVPPSMFMAPSSPMIQQAHTSVNVTYSDQDYKLPVHNTSMSLSSRFPSHCETYETTKKVTQNRMKSALKRNNFQRDHKQHCVSRNISQRLSTNDLRNVLTARKCHNDFKNTGRKSEGNFAFIFIMLHC